MENGPRLGITPTAAAELVRQAALAGKPGLMHLDLIKATCDEGWLYIRLQPGECGGVPLARADGITLFAPAGQFHLLSGLILNYYGDLSGGGFLISVPEGAEATACGGGFRFIEKEQ